jgi:hypothetical protein
MSTANKEALDEIMRIDASIVALQEEREAHAQVLIDHVKDFVKHYCANTYFHAEVKRGDIGFLIPELPVTDQGKVKVTDVTNYEGQVLDTAEIAITFFTDLPKYLSDKQQSSE